MRDRKLRALALLGAGIAFTGAAGLAQGAFGTAGKTIVNVGGPNSADGVAFGKAGTIIGVGAAVPGPDGFDFAAVRLTTSGTPDSTFSGDGKQTTAAGGFDTLDAVVVQKDGAILAGGSTDAIDDQRRATLVRYEPDGDPDPTYSGDGAKIFPFGGKASDIEDIALQKDGKVVIAGTIDAPGDGQDALIARVKPNGKLDRRFGRNGFVRFGVKDGTALAAVDLGENGRIVAAGDTSGTTMKSPSSQLYAQLTSGGKLDRSFSRDGIYIKKVKGGSTRAEDLALDEEGRLLAAIGIFKGGGAEPLYGVAAIKKSGRLNKKFGKRGFALRDFGEDTSFGAIAIQKSGRIVVGGGVRSGDIDFLLARFTRTGRLDESFGFKGAAVTDFAGGSGDIVQALAIGKDDEIVAAGIGDGDFGFARYLANGAIDD